MVVQAQLEDRQRTTATIEVVMANCEGPDVKYSGLQVDYVELFPFTGGGEDQSKHLQLGG